MNGFFSFVATRSLSLAIKFDKRFTAVSNSPPPLSRRSRIRESAPCLRSSAYVFKNSKAVFSPYTESTICAVFVPSMIFPSTDGTVMRLRVTFLMIGADSPTRSISNSTTVPAGPRIWSIASERSSHSSLFSAAFDMMSPFNIPASFAGDPARICLTETPNSLLSTTAQMPSKSQERASLNFFVSSISKYALCLSPKESIIPLIIPDSRSFPDTESKPK